MRAFEDSADYEAFEVAVTADYDAEMAVEREFGAPAGKCYYGGCGVDSDRKRAIRIDRGKLSA